MMVYVYMHTCMHTYIQAYMHTYMFICMCVYNSYTSKVPLTWSNRACRHKKSVVYSLVCSMAVAVFGTLHSTDGDPTAVVTNVLPCCLVPHL